MGETVVAKTPAASMQTDPFDFQSLYDGLFSPPQIDMPPPNFGSLIAPGPAPVVKPVDTGVKIGAVGNPAEFMNTLLGR